VAAPLTRTATKKTTAIAAMRAGSSQKLLSGQWLVTGFHSGVLQILELDLALRARIGWFTLYGLWLPDR
jgi:hypothetical protein